MPLHITTIQRAIKFETKVLNGQNDLLKETVMETNKNKDLTIKRETLFNEAGLSRIYIWQAMIEGCNVAEEIKIRLREVCQQNSHQELKNSKYCHVANMGLPRYLKKGINSKVQVWQLRKCIYTVEKGSKTPYTTWAEK